MSFSSSFAIFVPSLLLFPETVSDSFSSSPDDDICKIAALGVCHKNQFVVCIKYFTLPFTCIFFYLKSSLWFQFFFGGLWICFTNSNKSWNSNCMI